MKIHTELMSLEAMREKAARWKEQRSITPWVVIVALLAVWLGLGTVCIIHVIGQYF